VTDQSNGFMSRRGFLGAAAAAGAAGAAGITAAGGLAGCSSALKQTSTSTTGGAASGGTIKIGFVSPQTGQLSVFTQSNGYVLGQVRSALAKGLTIGGKKYSVEIIAADSQSSSARAATVASGFEKYMKAKLGAMGWKVVPSGGYTDGTSDFASIIAKFKAADVDILHAAPIPPDFITFWRQAHQNGFTPKVATISKALLFPSAAAALGPLVNNVMSPLWWTPQFPYRSSLDGTTASAFAANYKTRTGNDWTQPMGFNYAVFEIAVAALKASGDPTDKAAVASAIGKLKGQAITGAYDFTSGPVPHVSQIPELLAQWRVQSGSPQLVVIDNSELTAVPTASQMQML
jgi:ABC-type branched-subunit amino acid transport system substrate-binding protein